MTSISIPHAIVFAMSIVVAGCSAHSRVRPEVGTPRAASDRGAHNAALLRISVTDGGAIVNPDAGFQNRFLAALNDTGVFRRVVFLGGGLSDQEGSTPPFEMALNIVQVGVPNEGVNTLKVLATGVLLYLPSPVMKLHSEFISRMQLTVAKAGEPSVSYSGEATGYCSRHVLALQTDAALAWQKTVAGATDSALNQVLTALVADQARYR